MEFCHSSAAEDMARGEMEECIWQMRQEGREGIFGTNGALTLPSFQLKKERRVENREMRGNCPPIININGEPKKTDFTRGLRRGYHKVSLHFLTHIMSHSKIRLSRELSYGKLSKGSSSPKSINVLPKGNYRHVSWFLFLSCPLVLCFWALL